MRTPSHPCVALACVCCLAIAIERSAFADESLGELSPPSEPPPPPTPTPAATPPAGAASSPAQSVKLTFESTQSAERPAEVVARRARTQDDAIVLHGFRLGYAMVMNYDQPLADLDGQSLKEKLRLKSPSHFIIGYEVVYRVVGHSWLNVLLLGNVMIAGLEQSRVLPTGNLLIGAELANSFQLGVGAHLAPLKGSEAHTIVAAGWTPKVGSLYTPVHVFFVPDVEGVNRLGVTTGVTF
ncbi:MAG: hypothetical protein KF819_22270 [Labilithrix sp.]|nr:hypothetical protein [Labilithrix sp.]